MTSKTNKKVKNKIIHAFGVPVSPVKLVDALVQSNIDHTVISDNNTSTKGESPIVTVVPSSKHLSLVCNPNGTIVLLCEALSFLRTTNLLIIDPSNLQRNVEQAINYGIKKVFDFDWKLKVNAPNLMEYVDIAVKPSYLNLLQACFYRVPVAIRKEVQNLTISYLAGGLSKQKLLSRLSANAKLAELYELVSNETGDQLRKAVSQIKNENDVNAVSEATGFPTFELLYILKSAEKNK